jgi:hypothetical protein
MRNEVLDFLVNQYPRADYIPSEEGDLALHLARRPEDRDTLLEDHPLTLLYATNDGSTAIGMIQAKIERNKQAQIQEKEQQFREALLRLSNNI